MESSACCLTVCAAGAGVDLDRAAVQGKHAVWLDQFFEGSDCSLKNEKSWKFVTSMSSAAELCCRCAASSADVFALLLTDAMSDGDCDIAPSGPTITFTGTTAQLLGCVYLSKDNTFRFKVNVSYT